METGAMGTRRVPEDGEKNLQLESVPNPYLSTKLITFGKGPVLGVNLDLYTAYLFWKWRSMSEIGVAEAFGGVPQMIPWTNRQITNQIANQITEITKYFQ